jgi:hypothetical protein
METAEVSTRRQRGAGWRGLTTHALLQTGHSDGDHGTTGVGSAEDVDPRSASRQLLVVVNGVLECGNLFPRRLRSSSPQSLNGFDRVLFASHLNEPPRRLGQEHRADDHEDRDDPVNG